MKKEIKEELRALVKLYEKHDKRLEDVVDKEDFKSLCKKLEIMKKYIANDFELTRKYTQAMSFLNWFDFYKLYSDKLREEAMYKKYNELSEYMTLHNYDDYKLKFVKDEEYLNLDNKSVQIGLDTCFKGTKSFYSNDLHVVNSDNINNIYIDGHRIELEREKQEETKWEETVDYVVSRPFEFGEGVVIAVANYLKEVIGKDKQIKRYKNGEK